MPTPGAGAGTAERDITEILERYTVALDRRDWDLLASCFTQDAVVSFEGFHNYLGRDALVAGCRTSLLRFTETLHLIGRLELSIDTARGTATSSCVVVASHVRLEADGRHARFTIGGHYHDDLVLTGRGWAIERRTLRVSWECGDPSAMR